MNRFGSEGNDIGRQAPPAADHPSMAYPDSLFIQIPITLDYPWSSSGRQAACRPDTRPSRLKRLDKAGMLADLS